MMIFYLGPDSLLPLGSILAAVAGFILLFWNRIAGFFRKGRGPAPDALDGEQPEWLDPPDSPDESED